MLMKRRSKCRCQARNLHTAYLWVLAGRPANFEEKEPLVWMDFKTNRKHENAEELIEDYNKIMHSDIFQGYEKLADTGQFTWAPCWVHARRKFMTATENDFQKENDCKFTAIMAMDNEADQLAGEVKLDFRQKYVEPMVDELISFLEKEEITPKVMVSKSLSNACSYFLKRKQYFKNFLLHPKAEMDNNAAERSIRPLKVGNKNWLFIGSQAGGDACAVMTSLLQSAKKHRLKPSRVHRECFAQASLYFKRTATRAAATQMGKEDQSSFAIFTTRLQNSLKNLSFGLLNQNSPTACQIPFVRMVKFRIRI